MELRKVYAQGAKKNIPRPPLRRSHKTQFPPPRLLIFPHHLWRTLPAEMQGGAAQVLPQPHRTGKNTPPRLDRIRFFRENAAMFTTKGIDVRVTEKTAMDTIVENRIKAILDAHANNMIEGLDMGKDNLQAMLLRAREPISDEDFERKEITLWRKKYSRKAF